MNIFAFLRSSDDSALRYFAPMNLYVVIASSCRVDPRAL